MNDGVTRKPNARLLQWHPAFFADLQIELKNEQEYLTFEQEHSLGTKPMLIDVVVKKEQDVVIQKNIGRIFRRFNIFEYKSPDDYLSVDDFYKAYGYACFFKGDSAQVDSIPIEEITLSLVSTHYPQKLMEHLKQKFEYGIDFIEEGIYYITGGILPIQIIITSQLSAEKNLWLNSLTNQLEDEGTIKHLIREYNQHAKNTLYRAVMNLIVNANQDKFMEEKEMCEALLELFAEDFEEKVRDGRRQVSSLHSQLLEQGRIEDLRRATTDESYQLSLLKEFGILL